MDSYTELQKIMNKMIEGVPCEWGAISQELKDNDFHMVKIWAMNRLKLLERLVTYAELRGGNGCGDSGHDLALEATR